MRDSKARFGAPLKDAYSEERVTFLILNQYRNGSGYKDVVGKLYHFPLRYLKALSELPSPFIYYEPREGGGQIYFGTGKITSVYEDTEDVGHAFAEIGEFREFPTAVDFYSAPGNGTWENAKTMRNSVRRVETTVFDDILKAGGIVPDVSAPPETSVSAVEDLQHELRSLPGPGKRAVPILRRIRRILESYERPSAITNLVKRTRGDSCQLCASRGFLKRDSNRYCEVHHLFHLAKDPPSECLSPEYLVVLCANCHRKMHYGDVGNPSAVPNGWKITIEGADVIFATKGTEPNKTSI